MRTIFGVNSATPINKKLKNGYTMYDWVKRQKCFPAFCMRTLSGEDKITAEEIEFLKAKDCKIGLVIRDLTEAKVSGVNGTEDAFKAIETAKQLGVPQNEGIALFADIKSEWSVNHNWMISFARTLINCGYRPGFIGNTDSSEDFNFGRQCSHYVLATRKENQLNSVYWSVRPQYKFDPEVWATYAPSQLLPKDMHVWQYGTVDFHSIIVGKCYAHDELIAHCFWGE